METKEVSQPIAFEMIDADNNGEVTAEEFQAAEQTHGDSLYLDTQLLASVFDNMSLDEIVKLAPPGLIDQGAAELFDLLRELAEAEKDIDIALKAVTRALIDFFVEQSKEAAQKQMSGAIASFAINMVAAAATVVVACAGMRYIGKAGAAKTDIERSIAMQMSQLWTMTGSQAAGVAGSFSQPISEIFNAMAALIRAVADEAKEHANVTGAEQGEASEARKSLAQSLLDLIKSTEDANRRALTA